MYEFLDKNGKISANAANVIVIDKNGLVKQIGTGGGGGSPTGPAGGDLSGTYPNPSVVWNNGTSTYNLLYYPIPTGTISQYIRGDGSLATFPTIPTIPTYTVNNGLTESPANNFQLGGALVKNTTIDSSTFDLIFTGTKLTKNNYTLVVKNTSTGSAIKAEAGSDGIAINAISTDGPAINAVSTNDSPFDAYTTNGQAASFVSVNGNGISVDSNSFSEFSLSGGTGTSIDTILKLSTSSTIAGSVGNGLAIDIYAGLNNVGGSVLTSKIASVYENVTSLNESAALDFSTIGSGTLSRKMSIKGTGQLQLDKYTGTTFDSSPTKSLGVDASGNIITFTSGASSATWGSITGTLTSQTDLINYLTTNYYPIPTGTVSQYIDGTGAFQTFPTITSGTVTSVAALTLGTTGTDLTSTVANPTTTPVITLNVPDASATARGALTSTDWNTFNGKQNASTRRNANNSTNNNVNYCGVALGTGVSESATVWTITRLTISYSGAISIATATNVAWTNRESAIYI